MSTITFDDNVLLELNEDDKQFETDVKLASSVWFYSQHRLTIGQAAKMAGMSVQEFMLYLGKCNIPCIDYPATDLEREMKSI
jgi:predicted HTH domain antitoxin